MIEANIDIGFAMPYILRNDFLFFKKVNLFLYKEEKVNKVNWQTNASET